LRDWARDVDEIWDDFEMEIARIVPAGENRAVTEFHITGTARASGAPLDTHTGQVWTWDDAGVIARNDSFTDPREAFALAGVPYRR
jgi:ketosteroid isomerase-like protein